MYKKIFKSITLSSLAVASFNVQSAEDEIIVTANRYAQSINESLSSVTVISRNEIEKSAATDLPSLLGQVAGLDMKNNGPYGKQSSIFMRGTNSSHTLTLVDGIKLYSASAGITAYQHIPLSQIERIEIVRGPRSSLYGSEAIGGVIQIFTRKGSKETNASTSVGFGENNTRDISALFSGSDGNANFSLNVNHSSTDGIDAIVHENSNDDDGYINDSVTAKFGYKFNEAVSLESTFMGADGNTEFDNCLNNVSYLNSDDCDSDITQQSFSNVFNFTADGIWDSQLTIGTSRDDSENFWESQSNYTYETKRIDASFINNFQLSETQLVILGIDYSEDTVNTTEYANNSRDNAAAFIAWDSQYDSIDLSVSARHDDNEQFDTHSTGSIAAGYAINDQLKLIASYGTAFKAPTFNDLYFPFFGNENLNPEESETAELSIRGTHSVLNWSFNVYQTEIDNLIAYDPNTSLAANVNEAGITGAELITDFSAYQWDLNIGIAYIDTENKSGDNQGKELIARAKENLNFQVYRSFGKLAVSAAWTAQGKRYISLDNSESLAGYGIVDANIDYALNKQMKLSVKINNITDKEYAVAADSFNGTYNTLDRTLFVNLSYNM